MDIEKRVTNLENLVNALIKRIDNEKVYSSADMAGARHGISENTETNEKQGADIDFIAMEMGVDL